MARPGAVKEGEERMFETIKEIVKSTGVVVFAGSGFILTVKLLTFLVALL